MFKFIITIFFILILIKTKLKIMAITKTKIEGTKIFCEIDSSNLKNSVYDTEDKKLVVEFKNGVKYEYEEVPHNIFAQMRLSDSQGKFFNTKIAKVYKYKKLEI
jgi:hypothetical protein